MFPGIRRFLAARHHYAYLRTAGDILFAPVVISGLFGPRDARSNVAVFLSWGLMLNGSIAGCYSLWQFCLNDFEGHVRF